MKCLKCKNYITGIICIECDTDQEQYLFENLDKIELVEILDYIFHSGQFEMDTKILNSVFGDVLVNFPQQLYIYKNVLDEELLRCIYDLSTNEEAQRFLNVKTRYYKDNFGLSEDVIYISLKSLIESINKNIKLNDMTTIIVKESNSRVTTKKLHNVNKILGGVVVLSIIVVLMFVVFYRILFINEQQDNLSEKTIPDIGGDTIIMDTQAPIITLNGEELIWMIIGHEYQELGASVVDNKDINLEVVITGNVDINTPGTYTILYNVTDETGNKATEKKRTIIYEEVPDTEPPVILLIGEETINIEEGEEFQELGATVVDNEDKDLEVEITGSVDIDTPGTYILYYNVEDKAGNNAVTRIRVINVEKRKVDNNKVPIITLNGESTINVKKVDGYQELGASVVDDIDENLKVEITGIVDINTPGIYYIYYNATDTSGNEAIEIVRTIIVDEPSN
ncbi:DUF5011 domain-containing protein [Mycoplasmatota bacterium WC44]